MCTINLTETVVFCITSNPIFAYLVLFYHRLISFRARQIALLVSVSRIKVNTKFSPYLFGYCNVTKILQLGVLVISISSRGEAIIPVSLC